MREQQSAEFAQVSVEYEIHFNRGDGWQALSKAIQGSSPVDTHEQAWENLARLEAIAAVDPYYRGAETRIVRVERTVVSVGLVSTSPEQESRG
jgi:hypothetical protein